VETGILNTITLSINGVVETIENPDPAMTLANYLRFKKNLTGTKVINFFFFFFFFFF
jgi:hypothetical protein